MYIRFFYFLWLFLPCFCVAQTASYNFYFFKKALVAEGQGNYKTAILDYTIFINDHLNTQPPYPKAYYHRGICAMYIKDFKAATQDFERLHAITTTETDGARLAGKCYYAQADYTAALAWFRKAVARQPLDAQLYNEIGMAYSGLNDNATALRSFYTAIKYDSTFAMAYNNAGAALYFNQDIDVPEAADVRLAQTWFGQAIRRDSALAIAWKNKGATDFFLHEYATAKTDLAKAVQLDDHDPQAKLYLGITEAALGNFEAGIALLQNISAAYPHLETAREELGHIARQRKQTAAALDYYAQAAEAADPKSKLYKGLMSYYKASVYADIADETNMLQQLKAAAKQGVFADRAVYNDLLRNAAFAPFRANDKFQRFLGKLLHKATITKFNSPQLRWFKMRQGAAVRVGAH